MDNQFSINITVKNIEEYKGLIDTQQYHLSEVEDTLDKLENFELEIDTQEVN